MTAQFRKELEEIQTLASAGKRTNRTKAAATAAESNEESKYIIYSAASPLFINNGPDYATALTHPIPINTANVIAFAKQRCRQTLTLPEGFKIDVEALNLPVP